MAKSLSLSVTMENFNFSASSQKMEQPFSMTGKKTKYKSPSQKKCDQIRKKKFLEKKLEQSNSENTSKPEATLFSCESCDYVNTKKRGLEAHIRKNTGYSRLMVISRYQKIIMKLMETMMINQILMIPLKMKNTVDIPETFAVDL